MCQSQLTIIKLFYSNIGVRQGENLSPLLFSLYLNVLNNFFQNNENIHGITIRNGQDENDLFNLLKMFILLYADGTVIMAESADELQKALNIYEQYCDTWRLTVNITKTKLLVFSKGRQPNYKFKYKNEDKEIVNEYKYLGIFFSKSGSFFNCRKHMANQATKAMYSLIKNSNRLSLPKDLQIDLFKKTVIPILLYGVEIWGFGSLDLIERVQLKFLKYVLKLKRSTPNYIVYGETGCLLLSVYIKERIILFWSRLLTAPNKLSSLLYRHILHASEGENEDMFKKKCPWLHRVKAILIKCGLINIWYDNSFPDIKWLQLTVKQKLKDLFLNDWYSKVENSSNSTFYRVFKKSFGIESYLYDINASVLYYFIKFRTRNHRLPIETRNWSRIPINQIFCNTCQNNIGDEFHYLFECKQFDVERRINLKRYYYSRPNMFKLEKLMCSPSKSEFQKLCKFVKIILKTVRI